MVFIILKGGRRREKKNTVRIFEYYRGIEIMKLVKIDDNQNRKNEFSLLRTVHRYKLINGFQEDKKLRLVHSINSIFVT